MKPSDYHEALAEIERLQRENDLLRIGLDETFPERARQFCAVELSRLAAAEAALRIANIQSGRLPCVGNVTPESRVRGSGAAFGCGFEHGFRGQKRKNPYDRNPQMRVWEQGFEYGVIKLREAIDAAKERP